MSLNSFINPEFLEKQATHLDEGFLIGWIPGIITSIDDLEKLGRVKCSIPLFNESQNVPNAEDSMVWVLEDYTVPNSLGGTHRKLEVGSQVALLPLMGNPTQFILIGCIPNRKDRPHPLLNREKGTHGEVTPAGVEDIRFDDKNARYVRYPHGLTYQISEKGDWQLETLEGASYIAKEDGNILIDNYQGSISITPKGNIEQTNKSGVSSLLDHRGNFLIETPFKSKFSLNENETKLESPNNNLGNILNLIELNIRSKISKIQNKLPQLINLTENIQESNSQESNLENVDKIISDISEATNGFDQGVEAVNSLLNYPDEDLILDLDEAINKVQERGLSYFSSEVKEEIYQDVINNDNLLGLLNNVSQNKLSDLVNGLEYDRNLLEDAILKHELDEDYHQIRPISKLGVLDRIEYLQKLYDYLIELKSRITELQKKINTDTEVRENDNDIFSQSPLHSLQDKRFKNQEHIKELESEINKLEQIIHQDNSDLDTNLFQTDSDLQIKIDEVTSQINDITNKNNKKIERLERKIRDINIIFPEIIYEQQSDVFTVNNNENNILEKTQELEERIRKLRPENSEEIKDLKVRLNILNSKDINNIDSDNLSKTKINQVKQQAEKTIPKLKQQVIELRKNNQTINQNILNSNNDVIDNNQEFQLYANQGIGNNQEINRLQERINQLEKEVRRVVISIQLEFPSKFRKHISLFYLESLWEFPNPISRALNKIQKSETLELQEIILEVQESVNELPQLKEVTSGLKENNPNKVYHNSQTQNTRFESIKEITRELGEISISDISVGKLLGDYNPSKINLNKFDPQVFINSKNTPLGNLDLSTITNQKVKNTDIESLLSSLNLEEIDLSKLLNLDLNEINLDDTPIKDIFGSKKIQDLTDLSIQDTKFNDLFKDINLGQLAMGDFVGALNLDDILLDDILGIDLDSIPLGGIVSSVTEGINIGNLDISSLIGGLDLSSINLKNLDLGIGSSLSNIATNAVGAIGGIAKGIGGIFGGGKDKTDEVLDLFNPNLENTTFKLERQKGIIKTPFGSRLRVEDNSGEFSIAGGSKLTLTRLHGELSTFTGSDKVVVSEGKSGLFSATGILSTGGLSSLGGIAMSALGSGGVATGLSIAKNGLMTLGSFTSNKNVDNPNTLDLSKDSYEIDQENPLGGVDIGRDFVDIKEEDSNLHIGSGTYELRVGKNSSTQQITETFQDFRSGDSSFKLISGEGLNYNVEGIEISTPKFIVNSKDWLVWIEYIIQYFEGILEANHILMWSDDGFTRAGLNNLKDITLEAEILENNQFLKWNNESQQWENKSLRFEDINYIDNLNQEEQGVFIKTNQGWELTPLSALSEYSQGSVQSLINSEDLPTEKSLILWNTDSNNWEFINFERLQREIATQEGLIQIPDEVSINSFIYFDGKHWVSFPLSELRNILGISFQLSEAIKNPRGSFLTYSPISETWNWKTEEWLSSFIKHIINEKLLVPERDRGQALVFSDNLNLTPKYIPNFSKLTNSGIVNLSKGEWLISPLDELVVPQINSYFNNQVTPNTELSIWVRERDNVHFISEERLASFLINHILPLGTNQGDGLGWNNILEKWTVVQSLDSLKYESPPNESLITWDNNRNRWTILTKEFLFQELKNNLSINDFLNNIFIDISKDSLLIWSKDSQSWEGKSINQFQLSLSNIKEIDFYTDTPITDNSLLYWNQIRSKWVVGFPDIAIENLYKINIETELNRDNIVIEWDKELQYWRSKKSIRKLVDIEDVLDITNNIKDGAILKWSEDYNQWIPQSIDTLGVNLLSELLDTDVETVDNIPNNDEVLTWDETNQIWKPTPKRKLLEELDNVSSDTPENEEVLTWDGTNQIWKPTPKRNLLEDLENISSHSPRDDEVLTWDEANQVWKPTAKRSYLQNLDNVSTNSPNDDEVLTWDSLNQIWKPTQKRKSLSELDDVSSDTPGEGFLLKWDSNNNEWTPINPDNLIISSQVDGLNSIGDVSISGDNAPSDGQVLTFDAINFQWIPTDAVAPDTTDDLPEGTINVYYTDSRVDTRLGEVSITSLADINTTTVPPLEGNILAWDASNSEWKPENINNLSFSLNSLSNIDLSQLSNNHVLIYNVNTNLWETSDFGNFDIINRSITELNDVESNPSLEVGHILIWDGVQWTISFIDTSISDINEISNINTLNISSSDGQILRWSEFNNSWVRANFPDVTQSVQQLSDTDVLNISAQTGQFLVWNNSTNVWERSITTLEDLTDINTNLFDLNDVDINLTTPLNNHVLKWDNSNSRWIRGFVSVNDLEGVDTSGNQSEDLLLIWDNFRQVWKRGSLTIQLNSIHDIDDVETTNIAPSSSQYLGWDNTNQRWERKELPSLASDIDGLSNVNTQNESPIDNQILIWNQTSQNWVRSNGDINSLITLSIEQLNDVVIDNVSYEDNQILIWNNSNSQWQRGNINLSLEELNNVDVGSLNDNDVLSWDTFTSRWIGRSLTLNASQLEGFNYDTNNLSIGEILKWDGNNWTPSLDIGDIGSLSDTNIASPSANQILKWDSISNQWFNGSLESLNEIDEISITYNDINNNDLLAYNYGLSQWEAKPISEILNSINDLNDVDTSTSLPITNNILKWNGSHWIPEEYSINNLGGVDLTTNSPNNNNILKWDGANWIPEEYSIHTLGGVDLTTNSPEINNVLSWNGSVWIPKSLSIDSLNNVDTSTSPPTVNNSLIWNGSNWIPQNISLDSLENVDVTSNSPTTNDVLVWNGSSWIPESFSVSLLSDVDTSTLPPSINNVLQWDGSNWIPKSFSIDSLNNVDTSTSPPAINNSLIWDGSNWIPQSISVDSLEDVDLTTNSPSINNILKWDGSNWIPSNLSVDLLNDVDTSTSPPAINNVLSWDGSNWIPKPISIDVTSLDSLGDVDLTTTPPSVNNVLRWDGSKWIPSGVSVNVSSISSLGDVDLTSLSLDNILSWNGSQWIPKSLFLDSLEDVNLTTNSPEINNVLVWDGSNWIPESLSIDSLNNVDTTTSPPAIDGVLSWNGSSWIPKNLSVNSLNDIDTSTVQPVINNVLKWDGLNWIPKSLSIDSLEDVDTSTLPPEINDILYWDGSNWIPTSLSTNSLTDVDTTTSPPAINNVLAWDGSNWIPESFSIDSLNDVDLTTNPPVINNLLSWDGSNWIPTSLFVDSLEDVDLTTNPPAVNNLLKWDGSNWIPLSLTLEFLENVDISNDSLEDRQVLTWDHSNSIWTPKKIQINSLSEIGDVDFDPDSLQNENILIWNSTDSVWQPSSLYLKSINFIEDVEINSSSLNNNSILKWDEAQSKWVNQDLVIQLNTLSQIANVDTTTYGKDENYVIVWEASSQKWVSKGMPLYTSSINLNQDVNTDVKGDQDVLTWIETEGLWKPKQLELSLSQLTDTNITDSELSGKLLVWNSSTSKWEISVFSIEELGATSLESIPDVELTNLSDKQFLVWDEVQNKWINQNLSLNIENINNVETTTKEDGDILSWSNSLNKWINRRLDINSVELGNLSDVNVSVISPNNHQLLLWNNDSNRWERSNLSQLNLNLDSFADIDTTVNSIQDQQLLVWSDVENKWIRSNKTLSNLEIDTLNDIRNVDTESVPPTNKSLLSWNSTANNWQPISIENLLTSLDILPDVDLSTAPTQNQILKWDSISSSWIPSDPGLNIQSTDDIPEGTSNFYFTQSRLIAFLETLSINNLIDVDTDTQSPTNGSVLSWSEVQNSWIVTSNRLITESSLVDLGDVEDIGSIEDQSILIWNDNESQWKSQSFDLSSLNNVDSNLSSPSDGAMITWDESQGMWVEGIGIESSDDIPEGTQNKYFSLSTFNSYVENTNLDSIGDVTYRNNFNQIVSKEQNHTLIWDTNQSKWKPSEFPVPETTDELSEGTVNLWFTETRAIDLINTLNLYELNDINYDNPEDGQVLAWDSTNSQWTPQQSVSPNSTDDLPEGNSNLYFKDSYVSNVLALTNLDIFADVYISNIQDNDFLVWNNNGNHWENKSNSVVASELLTGNNLNVFQDVNYTNPLNGQVLMWDETSESFIPGNPSEISLLSDDITEGTEQLFFTSERVNNVLNSTSISELTDISNDTPSELNVLLWDDSLSKWKPNDFSLSNLTDVDDETKQTNSLLFWNNGTGKWEDFNLTFNFLPEISISDPQDDDSLVWDGNLNQWVAKRPTSRINISGLSNIDKTTNLDLQIEKINIDGENSLYLEDLGNHEVKLTYNLELPIYERGDLLIYNGQEYTRLLLGEEQQVLTVDRSVFSGLRWENPRLPLQKLGNIAADYILTPSDHSYIYRIVDSSIINLPINESVQIGFKCTFKVDADNTTLEFISSAQIKGDLRIFTIKDNYISVIYEGLINGIETWSLYLEGFNYLSLDLFSDLNIDNPNNQDILTYDGNTGTWIPSASQSKLEIEGKQFSNPSLDISGISSKLILEDDLYIKDITPSGDARIGNKLSLPLTTVNSIITFDGNNFIEKSTNESNSLLVSSSTGLSWIKNYKSFLEYKEVTSPSYTLLEEDHGKILKIINECEISLPSPFIEGFYVDIRKESQDNNITILGNLLNAVPNLTNQYESITLLFENNNWLSEYNGGVSGDNNGGGSGLIVSNTQTTNFTATPNTSNPCDTSQGQIVCTLPESDEVIKIQCFDSSGVNPESHLFPNGFSKHSLTIQPNIGQTIQGSTNSVFLDNENSSISLIYNPTSKRWSISDGVFFNDINVITNTNTGSNDFTDYDKHVLSYSPFVYLPFKYLGQEPNLINYGIKENFQIIQNGNDKLKFNGSELIIKVTETTESSLEDDHYLYNNLSISPTFAISFKLKLTKDTNIIEFVRFLWIFGHEFSIDASHNLISSDGTDNNFTVSDSDNFATWTSIVYNIRKDASSDLFFNGRFKGTQDQMRFSTGDNDLIKIGLLGTGVNEKYNGIKIKDFMIFNRHLNEEERILLSDE